MTTAVQIKRSDALKVMAWCGWKGVAKWDNARIQDKIGNVVDVRPDEDPEDPEVAEALSQVMAALDTGSPIEILDDEDSGENPQKSETHQTEVADKPAKPAKQKRKKPSEMPKPAMGGSETNGSHQAETKDSGNRLPGVVPNKTRPYLAGQIIKKHGLTAGVTEAMIKELDAAYGRKNPRQSQLILSNAWHAINGMQEEYAVE